MGFFFKKLDRELRQEGAITHRIGLNMGDRLFSYQNNYTPYHGRLDNWAGFIEKFFVEKRIEILFLFGDCRAYQRIAIEVAQRASIAIYVFEEGYVRPHYITLEAYGVNDYSHLPRERSFYEALCLTKIPQPLHATPNPIVNWSIVMLYYFVAKLFHFRYRHYQHHRDYSAIKEFFFGCRSLLRKPFYLYKDNTYLVDIKGRLSQNYFFVPLQTHNDFQILQHSNYGSLEKFIIEVLESFAHHAPRNDYLLFKHHPMDRGRKNYKAFILEQAHHLQIEDRLLILHDIHLPTCLQHAKGVVTINSTVGLSSLYHGTPTITLGNALYDIEGLTDQQGLQAFWSDPSKPNPPLLQKFRNHLIKTTQLNGNFYGLFPPALRHKKANPCDLE
jgi:capsular polysaccharide export protein